MYQVIFAILLHGVDSSTAPRGLGKLAVLAQPVGWALAVRRTCAEEQDKATKSPTATSGPH